MTFDGRLSFQAISEKRMKQFPYQHLEPVCDSTYWRSYLTSGPNYIKKFDSDWLKYQKEHPDKKLLEIGTEYFRNIPLLQNVEAQILKCDVPPIYPQNRCMDRVMQLCHSYFKCLRSEAGFDKNFSYTLGTSGGIPWNKCGLKNKRQVLEKFTTLLLKYVYNTNYPDIACYNDKDELLSWEDILRKKSRGIFGSTFHGVIREKILYGRQNDIIHDMHQNSWIKYGFVKQYGGFDTFFKSLENKSFRWESDCSGYDRKIFLKFVYDIRNANIINADQYQEMIDRVTSDNVNPMVLLPNGYVVRRKTGNNSGKNNTTVDNSIAHFIINIYLFLKKLVLEGAVPEEINLSDILPKVNLGIYSDDKIGSFNLEDFGWTSPEDFLSFERDVYSEFGLELKASAQAWSLDYDLGRIAEKHSFLGSYAGFDEFVHMYVPVPRFGKICASFTQKYSGRDKVLRFIRYVVLTLNCVPKSDYFDASLHFLTWYYNHPDNRAYVYLFDEILNDLNLDTSLKDTFSKLYLGFES